MSYPNIQVGSFTFSVNPSSMRAELYRRPGQLKVLGRNMSKIESMGNEGIVVIRFIGSLIDTTGINKKADFISLYNEYRRNDPLLFVADMFSTKAARGWCFINEFSPIELGGRTQSYEYGLALTVIGFSDEWTRAMIFTTEVINNDFGVTGDKVIPMIMMSSGSSESISFSRWCDQGSIPCVLNPKLTYVTFEPTGSVDAWMLSGSLNYWCSGSESGWSNGMIQVVTRQDEATWPGMVEVWAVTGSGVPMQLVGYVDYEVQNSNGLWCSGSATGSIVVKSSPANKYENKYFAISKLFYPQTTTGSVTFNVFFEFWRGKPYFKTWVENSCSGQTLSGVKYKFIVNTGSTIWQNFTMYKSGSSANALTASGGTYGTISGSGINDLGTSGSATLLSTDYPLVSTSNMLGIIRPVMNTMNHVGVDVGNYWSEVHVEYTGSSVSYGNFFPEVFFFAQNYGLQGSRDENALAKEAMVDSNIVDDVIQIAV